LANAETGWLMLRIFLAFLLVFSTSIFAKQQEVLNIYNWGGFLPDTVADEFTKETGIKVYYSTYMSDEDLYAKLAIAYNHSNYDVIFPSVEYLGRMERAGMLEKIDKTKIPNFKNLDPRFVNQHFDPQNNYSVPYLWGSTGLVINRKYYPDLKFDCWQDLWNPQLRNKLLLMDDARSNFDVGLHILGYSINSQDPEQIQQAYEKLRMLLPNVKLFNMISPQSIYTNENAVIGMGYSGDTYAAMLATPGLEYIYPKDGAFLWMNSMAIPMNAPNLENAYKFINFILRADIAAEIATKLRYSTPNLAAQKLLPKAQRDSRVLYPTAEDLKHSQFEMDIGGANELYEQYWQELKMAT
jgi:spermidine/putrescine transport system substrate-binding protein